MSLSKDELEIIACLYTKKIIGKSHRRVDSIAGLCHIRRKKGLKKTPRRLSAAGVLNVWHGPAYSLTQVGVIIAERYLGVRP